MTRVTPLAGRTGASALELCSTIPLEEPVSDRLLSLYVRTSTRVRGADRERGDVPGWVMITLMTAAIVSVIWGVAEGALKTLFNDAITKASTKSG